MTKVTREKDRYTGLPNALLDSEAVRSLSPTAFKVLVYVAKRCWGAKRNGKFPFGARSGNLMMNRVTKRLEETSIGLGKSATAAALEELQAHGLLVCMKDSTFDQKRHAREWRLTWFRTESDLPTHDYRSFDKGAQKPKRSPPNRTVGAAIVRSGGQSPARTAPKPALQSATPDYSAAHSPPHRTRSYHRNRDVSLHGAGVVDLTAHLSSRAASGLPPSEMGDYAITEQRNAAQ